MVKKILVTGGAGFIGSRLVEKLLTIGYDVTVVDNLSPKIHRRQVFDHKFRSDINFMQGDVRDVALMADALKDADVVVHLASETGTGESMYDISRYFDVNVQGTANIIELIDKNRNSRISKIVLSSSRAIYGEGKYLCQRHGIFYPNHRDIGQLKNGVFNPTCPSCNREADALGTPEDAPKQPTSVYGQTKQFQEEALLMYSRRRALPTIALRYQNVYGPGQSLINPYTGILAVFSNLIRQGAKVNIFEDGQESRDFIYVDDVVDATIDAITCDGNFSGPLNIGSGTSISVLSVAEKIKEFFNSDSELQITGEYRLGDIRHNFADLKSALEILSFQPKTSFDDGLKRFLEWASTFEYNNIASYNKSLEELRASNNLYLFNK